MTAPDDDTPRAVLADHLLEHGDPRGELIALQLARARTGTPATKRERSLLATHAATWCGALAAFVARDGLQFERGFLAIARAAREWREPGDVDPVIGADEWATVHTLCCKSASTATPMLERIVALLGDPSMRSLRALHNLPWELAHAIESTPLGARLHVLGLASVFLPRNSVRTLGGTGLNDVRALWLTDVFSLDHLGLLVVSPLWARLEEITLVPTKDLAGQTRTCVEWIAAHGRQLRRFRLIDECTYPPRWGGWCLALSPLDGGFALDARFETLSHGARFATLNLAIKLDALEPGTLRAIRIARTPAFPVRDDPYTARLRVACERHRPVVLELPS